VGEAVKNHPTVPDCPVCYHEYRRYWAGLPLAPETHNALTASARDEPQDAAPEGVTGEQWIRVKALEVAVGSLETDFGANHLIGRARQFEHYIKTGE
jgi:hypothetical protein